MYSGKVGLENLNGEEVALGDDTQYRAFTEAEELQRTITYYDFNADGTPDTVVHGTVKDVIQTDGSTVNRFVAENTPQLWTTADTVDWQGVYFRAEDAATQAPDLLRRADTQKRLDQSIGLLTQISQEDYRNTDILIFRESTGQLILHRRGLSDAEIQGRPQTGFDETDNRFAYRVMLRGPRDSDLNIGGGNRSGGYSQFASTLKMAAPFQHREADHPKPGETVRVVAINRATGYIGTARTPLTSAAGNAMASVEVPEITMRPPNLKIWAERISTVEQGMTQGEERHHVIGSEGAGLTSDTTITLYTEWLDSDGTALPTELGLDDGEQFGLTGRLAKIVAPNTLAATAIGSSSLAEFPIAPGRRTQALQIGSNLSQAEHFYIHVVGTPKDADPPPNFAIGDAVAPYDSRPRRFTPFLVPLFDEASTMADYNAYRQLQARDNPPEDLRNPPPTYVWQFRPEYQFSQFDLDMRAIERVTGLGTPQEERTDILNTQTPVIASSDDLIQALYSLIGNQFDRLSPIDGKQELLLALGETETLVELGQDKTLRFSNLQSLASLNPEDFLTMRLYTNNDAGNVLWEWAFGLKPFPLFQKDEISADTPQMEFAAFAPTSQKPDGTFRKLTLQWSVDQGGSAQQSVTESSNGIHPNVIRTSVMAGTQHHVTVKVLETEDASYTVGTVVTFGPFIVKPGEPHTIDLTADRQSVPADDVSRVTLQADIYDQHANRVEDGTPVHWYLANTGELKDVVESTLNGRVTAHYVAASALTPTQVYLQSSDALTSLEVTKTALDVSLSTSVASIPSNSNDPVILSVTVTGSDQLDGQEVVWNTTSGELSQGLSPLSDGTASVELYPSGMPGEALVSVAIAGFEDKAVVHFEPAGTVMAELALPAIVADALDGSVVVDALNGPVSHEYVTHTDLIVYGTPGEEMAISPGGLYTPNGKDLVHLAMNDVENYVEADGSTTRRVADHLAGLQAKVFGPVTYDHLDSFEGNGGSLKLQGGYLILEHTPILDIPDDFYANVRFKVSASKDDQLLMQKGEDGSPTFTLKLVTELGETYLQAQIKTDAGAGLYTLKSNVPVTPGEWHIAGFKFQNNQLILGLDEDRTSIATAGKLTSSNDRMYIGARFQGRMDDVKFGREAAGDALIGLSANQVTIGADGKGRVMVQATGRDVALGQRVGFTLGSSNTPIAQRKELQFIPAKLTEKVLDRLLPYYETLGISTANAEVCGRACAARRQQEQGVTVTNKDVWGSFQEMVTQRLLNDEVTDAVKTTAQFIFELTSLNDIWVIMKTIYYLAQGRTEEVDGFEATFAVIAVGITVVAVISTGGTSLAPLKAGLTSFKGLLKVFWNDVGGAALIQIGTVTSKEFVRLIKLFLQDRPAAMLEFARFAEATKVVVTGAIAGATQLFLRTVDSVESLRDFVRIFGRAEEVCLLASSAGSQNNFQYASQHSNYLIERLIPDHLILSGVVHAAPCSKRLRDKIAEIAVNTARFGSEAKAAEVAKVLESLEGNYGPAFGHFTAEAMDGLALAIHSRIPANATEIGKNGRAQLKKMFDEFSPTDLNVAFGAVHKLDTVSQLSDADKLLIAKKMATKNKNDAIGTIHMLKDIEGSALSARVLKLEEVEDFTSPFSKGRRTDLVAESPNGDVRMEYKGSKSGQVKWDAGGAQLEFLNDVYIFGRLDEPKKFMWVLSPNQSLAEMTYNMRKVLGNGNLEDMHPDLRIYLKSIETLNRPLFSSLTNRIDEILDALDSGVPNEFLRHATYP